MGKTNGNITGTWEAVSGDYVIVAGTTVRFQGYDTVTQKSFTASYTGASLGVSAIPVSASGVKFTFNGPLDQFAGWSVEVSATAGVHASYSINSSGYSLVMYGGETDVGVTLLWAGYTTLSAPIKQSNVYGTNLGDLTLSHPFDPEASYFRAMAAGDTVAAARKVVRLTREEEGEANPPGERHGERRLAA